MIELFLSASMACPDADAMILRIEKHKTLKPEVKIELVETVKDSLPECYWGAND